MGQCSSKKNGQKKLQLKQGEANKFDSNSPQIKEIYQVTEKKEIIDELLQNSGSKKLNNKVKFQEKIKYTEENLVSQTSTEKVQNNQVKYRVLTRDEATKLKLSRHGLKNLEIVPNSDLNTVNLQI